ncbi:hypothetical protein QHH03_32300, partial [Aphanizomenon sp. 202]|nr:hypothetical protein [Aphanizomenon sp. 202]
DDLDVVLDGALRVDHRGIDLGASTKGASRRREARLDSIFQDLEACHDYEARVRATSRTQLHSDWVTAYASTP